MAYMGQPNQQASAPTAELGHMSFPGQGTIEDNSRFPTCSQGCSTASRNDTLNSGNLRKFGRLPNTMSCVLLAFTLRAWVLNHSLSDASDASMREIRNPRSLAGPLTNTWVSSAYWKTSASPA